MPDESDTNLRRGNESFYRSDPADYLETRLQTLVIIGARRTELVQMLAEGVEYAGITIGPAPPDGPEFVDDGSLDRFLTIESQQLLHHASETTLRLFQVFATGSTTPWIELNRERMPRRFKEAVEKTFITGTPEPERVADVCLGSRTPRDGITQDEWDVSVSSITAFLAGFAKCFLEERELYNGIKHGLGVAGGDAVFIVDATQLGGGPSVEHPISGDFDDQGNRVWSMRTSWVDIGWSLAMVKVASHIIGSMWQVARYRHLGGEPGGQIWFPGALKPEDLRSASRHGGQRMTWHLATEHDPSRVKKPAAKPRKQTAKKRPPPSNPRSNKRKG